MTTDWPAVHRNVVDAFTKGWAHPGPDAWDHILIEDVVLNQPMLPPTVGRKMWQQEGDRLLALLPDLRGDVLSWAGRDDILFIELELSATLGGKPFAFRAVDKIWITSSGEIARRDSFFDSVPIAQTMLTRPTAWLAWWRSGLGPFLGRRRFVG
ncbi:MULTISPECIES: nuclear transport factor 2 family protein [unclassified Mycobacterium]|uniref:nuclear transport factor 2 family protein n=1 Tax=unclassified Mycobacterium TaxID=2642494 RepID=UPI0029C7F9BA|nr:MULTISPECIES: nuclear transport factor 2 family protein [unclassified Mycobacterium]